MNYKKYNDYELFTRHIYEVIVNNSVLSPTYVKRNIKLKGKSGLEHQIDVYFEYEDQSGKHRFAIECKNYSSLVPVGKVRDYFGVIYDLKDDVKGIMVSRKGFQRGAKVYAEKYGISLIELREVTEKEIIGAIESHHHWEKTHHLFLIDEAFATEHKIDINSIRRFYSQFQVDKKDSWLNSPYIPLETKDGLIYDSNGLKLSSIDEIDYNTPFKKLQNYEIRFKDGWVRTRIWGMVKINAVKIESEITEQEVTINLQASGFVEALIKDVLSNESLFVPKLL